MFILTIQIAFNGQHFTEFNHRVPFLSISNLAVDGDVIVHNVYFTEPNSYENNNNPTSPPAYGFHTGMLKYLNALKY